MDKKSKVKPKTKSKSKLNFSNITTILLVIILLIGLGLLAYPSFSDYWNKFHQSQAIAGYAEKVADLDEEDYDKILNDAKAYNEKLAENPLSLGNLTEEELKDYNSQLNIDDTGIMGYIEIDKINCNLPIYHGTDEGVLQIAAGHIEGSSLPVGGESTHAVISGHRGLPSAKLFTDLDQMEVGDTFVIRVLDETMTYEVDQIRVVLPNELSDLEIEQGKDLVTLVTCTPYGINTHRLLVRGHRITNTDDGSIRVTADGIQIEPIIVAPVVAAPVLLILLIYLLIHSGNRSRKKRVTKSEKREKKRNDEK